jgi:hypothetical protein
VLHFTPFHSGGKEQTECTIYRGKYWCGLAFDYSNNGWGWCDEEKCPPTGKKHAALFESCPA